MTDQQIPYTGPSLADKTIANMEELRKAHQESVSGLVPATEVQKQHRTIQQSLARCRRCGDFAPSFPVAAPLAILCADCEKELKERDGVMWFAEMYAKIAQGKKS